MPSVEELAKCGKAIGLIKHQISVSTPATTTSDSPPKSSPAATSVSTYLLLLPHTSTSTSTPTSIAASTIPDRPSSARSGMAEPDSTGKVVVKPKRARKANPLLKELFTAGEFVVE